MVNTIATKIFRWIEFSIFVYIFLCFSLLEKSFPTEITLIEDSNLLSKTNKVLMKIDKGKKFSFDYIDADWVYGAYFYENGVLRGKFKASAFKEQQFLKQNADNYAKQMSARGYIKVDGRWLSAEQKKALDNEAKGLINFEGQWLTLAEVNSIISERQNTSYPEKRTTETEENNTQSVSLEYQLAAIDFGGYVSKDDSSVKRFRSLLGQLSRKYVETKNQIADMTVKAQEMLDAEGINEKMLNIMNGLNGLFDKVENQKYAEFIAAYVTIRKNGGNFR